MANVTVRGVFCKWSASLGLGRFENSLLNVRSVAILPSMDSGNVPPPPSFYDRAVATIEKIAMKSISTGNFGWFVLLFVCGILIWKLDSADLKEVLLKVLATYGWLGYPVAGITIFTSVRILRWRERFYQQEMTRITELRNKLMQGKLELPLVSSVEKETK